MYSSQCAVYLPMSPNAQGNRRVPSQPKDTRSTRARSTAMLAVDSQERAVEEELRATSKRSDERSRANCHRQGKRRAATVAAARKDSAIGNERHCTCSRRNKSPNDDSLRCHLPPARVIEPERRRVVNEPS